MRRHIWTLNTILSLTSRALSQSSFAATDLFTVDFNQACPPTISDPSNPDEKAQDTVRFDSFTAQFSLPQQDLAYSISGYNNFSGQTLIRLEILIDDDIEHTFRFDPCTFGQPDLCPADKGGFVSEVAFHYEVGSDDDDDAEEGTSSSTGSGGLAGAAGSTIPTSLDSILRDARTYPSSSSSDSQTRSAKIRLLLTDVSGNAYACVQAGLVDTLSQAAGQTTSSPSPSPSSGSDSDSDSGSGSASGSADETTATVDDLDLDNRMSASKIPAGAPTRTVAVTSTVTAGSAVTETTTATTPSRTLSTPDASGGSDIAPDESGSALRLVSAFDWVLNPHSAGLWSFGSVVMVVCGVLFGSLVL